MQYLLLAVVAVAVAGFAPIKVTLSLLVCIGIVSLVVKITAAKLIGPVSMQDAFRSVAWAFALLTAAVVGVLWANQGQLQVEGVAAIALVCGLFAAFVLGFKIGLQASFGSSAAIAAISTVVSSLLLFALKPMLF